MAKKIGILLLLAAALVSSGFGCKTADKETQAAMEPVTLTYWRVFDDSDAFDEIINKYRALHPYVKIEYRKLRYEEYENELLNALAEDRGPDIFSVQSTWLKKYQTKLAPLPEKISMVYPVTSSGIKKEVTYQKREEKTWTSKDVRNLFVDVVAKDVILDDGKIYGLPLSVDTLAMYYNKDLLNNAGISQVPAYWNREFLQDIKKLTKQDISKNIAQSGAALGGSANINRYADILMVLMMQSGATIIDDSGKVVFNSSITGASGSYNPGVDALRFYSDFANPNKESYTWNKDLDNSLELFMSGKLALMFGYSYDLATIKAQAPKLNFDVAKLPQIEGNPPTNVNVANYWVESVSKKSAHIDEAWDFVQFIAKEEQAKAYLEKTGRPTALRSLIETQKTNENIGVFVEQLLTAKNWYRGQNIKAAEDAVAEMIERALADTEGRLQEIVNDGAAKIQQTIY